MQALRVFVPLVNVYNIAQKITGHRTFFIMIALIRYLSTYVMIVVRWLVSLRT